ncbi:large-conductance mechanosensitive channel [Oscillibacter valericigenes Sjm18-20]|nr:large-conductance mechanosensitive channel [Oscillibacter valericigenes Sjm18-20]
MAEKTTGFVAEFRKFIARGNVMDMAVGVIVGGAFKSIADSLVNDIIMPIISLATGNITFPEMTLVVGDNLTVIPYGNFLATILNFLITAFAVFCVVKAINRFYKKDEKASAAPSAPSREETLLTEIRDLLKEQQK